jgi:hypothetical protein
MTTTKVQARISDHGIIEKTETFFDDRFAGEETRALCKELFDCLCRKKDVFYEPKAKRLCHCPHG